MKRTETRIVVDTCVWLDMYLGMRDGSTAARLFFDCALEQDVTLLYSINTVKNLQFLIAHIMKSLEKKASGAITKSAAQAANRTAWACVDHMADIATAVACDAADIWMARKLQSVHADFEDNLVVAATHHADARFLVTCDEKLLAHSPVAAKTPTQMTELLQAGL